MKRQITVKLRPSRRDELPLFSQMSAQQHAKNFVTQNPLAENEENFAKDDFVYLTIENEAVDTLGFFILVLEEGGETVEFGRIVIGEHALGCGQSAITVMEQYCQDEFSTKRIWLDVFEDNPRAQHVYEKLGYTRFKTGKMDGRVLFFYEKLL